VVAGVEGVIVRSRIVPLDPTIHFVQFPARPDQTSFLFSGQPGQQFTLDRSLDILNWTVGALLQINNSGVLPYTDPGTNSPLHQFFRATPK